MKTLHHLLALLACLLPFARTLPAQECAAYAVADASTGHLLVGDHLQKKLQIGSVTKIAMAMVVIDWADVRKTDVGTLVTVPETATSVGGSNPVGFEPGDQVSIRDLLYAALLQSDNVAAHTLAVSVGRTLVHTPANATSEELFVAQMNALARKLGMEHTKFLNPHGLDNRERPYSTAGDLILLTQYAMKRSSFRFYVSQRDRRITRHTAAGGALVYNLVNTNELLGADSIDGVKTGRTVRAGECIVISAARPPDSRVNEDGSHTITPRRLIVVVLGATNRFGVASSLLHRGWTLYDEWATAGRPVGKRG